MLSFRVNGKTGFIEKMNSFLATEVADHKVLINKSRDLTHL
jgi:hypothetical protein